MLHIDKQLLDTITISDRTWNIVEKLEQASDRLGRAVEPAIEGLRHAIDEHSKNNQLSPR